MRSYSTIIRMLRYESVIDNTEKKVTGGGEMSGRGKARGGEKGRGDEGGGMYEGGDSTVKTAARCVHCGVVNRRDK